MLDAKIKLLEILGRKQLTRKELLEIGSDYFTKKKIEEALKDLMSEGKVFKVDRTFYEATK